MSVIQKITLVIVLIISVIVVAIFTFLSGNYTDGLFKKSTYIISDKELDCGECNLIIISLTNTRKDHIGIYGYSRDTTPSIDSYFKDGLIFEKVFSPTPWTLPNGISLFTSLFPYTHNIISRKEIGLIPEDTKTLAELLKENNYTTAAFTGGGDYNRIYGFGKGFDEYYDEVTFSGVSNNVDLATDWLEDNNKDPFFLFVQGFDTHCPFTSPTTYDALYNNGNSNLDTSLCYWNLEKHATKEKGQYVAYKQGIEDEEPVEIILNEQDRQKLVAKYDGSIRYADESLKKLFSTVTDRGLDKDTITIFLSEHGDLIGERGRFMRTDIQETFYDNVLNVPLLVKHPYIKTKKKINGIVNLVDIMPTLLSLLNISYDHEKLQGKDVRSIIANNKEVNEYAFAQLKYSGSEDNPFFKDIYEVDMIRSMKSKLIHEKTINSEDGSIYKDSYEFYDIKSDPEEIVNLFNNSSNEIDVLKSAIEKWKRSLDGNI